MSRLRRGVWGVWSGFVRPDGMPLLLRQPVARRILVRRLAPAKEKEEAKAAKAFLSPKKEPARNPFPPPSLRPFSYRSQYVDNFSTMLFFPRARVPQPLWWGFPRPGILLSVGKVHEKEGWVYPQPPLSYFIYGTFFCHDFASQFLSALRADVWKNPL